MSTPIRNRIKCHRRVRAGELVPHEWNYRLHPDGQKDALRALYQEVGFARSLLACELPDGRLKLIDGHLRRDLDPDMEVDVEILDVNEDEARVLLLSIDPLAALAQTQIELQQRLRELTPTVPPELQAAWDSNPDLAALTAPLADQARGIPEQYLVLVTCRNEQHQIELLERFQREGIDCKALIG